MYEAIKDFAIDDIRVALDTDDKRIRDERLKPIYEKVHEKFDEIYPDEIEKIDDCLYKTQKFVVRCLTTASALTAEASMRFARLRLKSTCLTEFTARVCSLEAKLRF